jgi:hypothetical protein
VSNRSYFLLEKAAGNFIERLAVCIIAQIVGLQHFIDHTTLRNIEAEKFILSKTGIFDKLVLFDPEYVYRVVLT